MDLPLFLYSGIHLSLELIIPLLFFASLIILFWGIIQFFFFVDKLNTGQRKGKKIIFYALLTLFFTVVVGVILVSVMNASGIYHDWPSDDDVENVPEVPTRKN